MRSIGVLFIEDEVLMQQFAGAALSKRGLKVFSAFNSTEADAILRREKVDVILCDILLPAENGLSYIRRLRDEGNRTPVIFLSALADSEVVKLGMESGAAAYMIKPYDADQLYTRILTVTGSERPAPPPRTPIKK